MYSTFESAAEHGGEDRDSTRTGAGAHRSRNIHLEIIEQGLAAPGVKRTKQLADLRPDDGNPGIHVRQDHQRDPAVEVDIQLAAGSGEASAVAHHAAAVHDLLCEAVAVETLHAEAGGHGDLAR